MVACRLRMLTFSASLDGGGGRVDQIIERLGARGDRRRRRDAAAGGVARCVHALRSEGRREGGLVAVVGAAEDTLDIEGAGGGFGGG